MTIAQFLLFLGLLALSGAAYYQNTHCRYRWFKFLTFGIMLISFLAAACMAIDTFIDFLVA